MTDTPSAERYRREGDTYFVDIHLRTVEQLFDLRDPAPFRERDLDDDAVAYLYDAMEDLRRHRRVAFRFTFESPASRVRLSPEELDACIRAHFRYEATRERRKLSAWWRQGQLGLLGAVGILLLSLAISTRITPLAQSNAGWNTAREAILIFGWVVLWHPLEALLFGWRAMAERLRLLERIAAAEYRFAFDAHTHRPE